MIDNFMTGDVSRDWTVKRMMDGNGMDTDTDMRTPDVMEPVSNLNTEDGALAPTPTASYPLSLTTEWSMGDGAATVEGTWAPTFHHKAGALTTDDPAAIPDAVTGTFNAMGNIGNLQGAFGANKMME